jgi:hypothetical protein
MATPPTTTPITAVTMMISMKENALLRLFFVGMGVQPTLYCAAAGCKQVFAYEARFRENS